MTHKNLYIALGWLALGICLVYQIMNGDSFQSISCLTAGILCGLRLQEYSNDCQKFRRKKKRILNRLRSK